MAVSRISIAAPIWSRVVVMSAGGAIGPGAAATPVSAEWSEPAGRQPHVAQRRRAFWLWPIRYLEVAMSRPCTVRAQMTKTSKAMMSRLQIG